MKKYILILIIIFELITINIPKYVELNNLAIIEEIAVEKKNNHYTLILKETIPIKDDQGINYKYKYYEKKAPTVEKAYKYLINSTKKKLYLKRTKSLITNTKFSKEIIKTLDISPKTITHVQNNVSQQIKKKS